MKATKFQLQGGSGETPQTLILYVEDCTETEGLAVYKAIPTIPLPHDIKASMKRTLRTADGEHHSVICTFVGFDDEGSKEFRETFPQVVAKATGQETLS